MTDWFQALSSIRHPRTDLPGAANDPGERCNKEFRKSMDKDFWHERWQRREIGFHRSDIHWALNRHWDATGDLASGRVLVPLCGKSLDLRWLAQQGFDVTGVELSDSAVAEFFEEWGKTPSRETVGELQRWQVHGVTLYAGDFFRYRADEPFDRFYDRAALVALPHDMRAGYLEHLRAQLSDNAQGLLVTFEYDQAQMDGPPFSVPEVELMQYPGFSFELLVRIDALPDNPRFSERGLCALNECAWRVTAI